MCNLCDGFVNFVVDNDPDGAVRFGPIQKHMKSLGKVGAPTDLSTVVLVQGDIVRRRAACPDRRHAAAHPPDRTSTPAPQFYTHSNAALRVMALLRQPWRSLSVFYLVSRRQPLAHPRARWPTTLRCSVAGPGCCPRRGVSMGGPQPVRFRHAAPSTVS